MGRGFITFTPVEGVYKEAIKPYKKWYEHAFMSPLIEVDEEYYRILRTTGWISTAQTRKLVVCDEQGHLIKDEKVTRECVSLFHYLIGFQDSSSIRANCNDDIISKLGRFMTEFESVLKNVGPHLTEEELEAMKFHLYYYKEVRRFSMALTEESRTLQTYIKPLEENQIKIFTASLIETLKRHFNRSTKNKEYITAMMIEDGHKARATVKKILRNKDYQHCFPDSRVTEQMIDEMYEAE